MTNPTEITTEVWRLHGRQVEMTDLRPAQTLPVETHLCADCERSYWRRTDLSDPADRPIVCHACHMAREAASYEATADAFLVAADDYDDLAAEIWHTGGGCHSVGVTAFDGAEPLEMLVGDAENGPLVAGHPPTDDAWLLSVAWWDHDSGEEFDNMANVVGTPTEILDACRLVAQITRTREGRVALDTAEVGDGWLSPVTLDTLRDIAENL